MWLALLASSLESLAATSANFDPDCPCIDVSQLFVDAGLQAEHGSDHCTVGSIVDYELPRDVANKTAFCHPIGYGSLTCQAWDAGYPLPHECGHTNAPQWCQHSWCYVDKNACRRSDNDVQGTLSFPEMAGSLFFSYGTCGTDAEDALSYATHKAPIRNVKIGEVLTVGIPAMDYPMHYKRDGNGSVVTGIGELYFDESVPWEGRRAEPLS